MATFGIDSRYHDNLELINNTLIENRVGISARVIGPSSVNHVYGNSFVHVQSNIFVGRIASLTCNVEETIAIKMPSFRSNDNNNMYATINGETTIKCKYIIINIAFVGHIAL